MLIINCSSGYNTTNLTYPAPPCIKWVNLEGIIPDVQIFTFYKNV